MRVLEKVSYILVVLVMKEIVVESVAMRMATAFDEVALLVFCFTLGDCSEPWPTFELNL